MWKNAFARLKDIADFAVRKLFLVRGKKKIPGRGKITKKAFRKLKMFFFFRALKRHPCHGYATVR